MFVLTEVLLELDENEVLSDKWRPTSMLTSSIVQDAKLLKSRVSSEVNGCKTETCRSAGLSHLNLCVAGILCNVSSLLLVSFAVCPRAKGSKGTRSN